MFCFQPWSEEKNEWISASNITRSYRQRIVILCAAATKIKVFGPQETSGLSRVSWGFGRFKTTLGWWLYNYMILYGMILPFLLYGMCWGLCCIYWGWSKSISDLLGTSKFIRLPHLGSWLQARCWGVVMADKDRLGYDMNTSIYQQYPTITGNFFINQPALNMNWR
jgi:hypothetical protein